jgi:tetratricopeptide (TPR) repeat protein
MAIPELASAVAIDPANVEAQANLGVLLFFRGRFAESIPHLHAALDRQAGLAKIQGLLGIAEARTSDFVNARKDLETAFPLIQEKKFKIQAGLELVGLDTQSGDLEGAASVAAQLRSVDPTNPEVLYAAYRTYSDLAGESMLALSLTAPDSAQMHQVMAHEEAKQGNTNGAIAQYRKAIAIDAHLAGVHFELAELLNTSTVASVKQEAEEEYRAALVANPLDEKAECRLAEFHAQKGDTENAIAEFTKAIAMQPADADAKLGLAKLLMDGNEQDKALKLLQETVQLEPTNALAHYRLGALYRERGQAEDAKREIETYKKLKDTKDKLRSIYKEMQIQPNEIRADDPVEK